MKPETAITSNGKQVRLARILVYPLKSARALAPDAWPVDQLGLAWDRRWAIVGADGRALTQREEPRLALVAPALGEHLTLTAPGLPPLELALGASADAGPVPVTVLGSALTATLVSEAADAWVRAFLGYGAHLVRLHEPRPVDPRYGLDPGDRTGFTDGFPFLVLGQGSLDDLNSRLADPVPVNRFRPSLLIEGAAPFAEDGWRRLRVGEIELELVKPCARCVITSTDQETGARSTEPLRTLAGYRRAESGKVMFGQNAIHRGTGTLRVGDPVTVLSRGGG